MKRALTILAVFCTAPLWADVEPIHFDPPKPPPAETPAPTADPAPAKPKKPGKAHTRSHHHKKAQAPAAAPSGN